MDKAHNAPAQRKYDDYEYTTVDEFAQKYGFSRKEAVGRIKWFLCATGREALWESEKVSIQRSEGRMMIFTPDDIVDYEAIVAAEKLPEPAATATGEGDELLTPLERVSQLRKGRECDEVIAAILKREYPELTAFDGMKFIDPERVKQWEESPCQQGRPKEWFNYRVKKGAVILKERENMTVS